MAFRARLVAITTAGTETSINLRGILSTPVIAGTTLIGTASLPDFANYTMIGNYGTNPSSQQSALYFLSLPMSGSSTLQAVALDGRYASAPVISNNLIYVGTPDFGKAMMLCADRSQAFLNTAAFSMFDDGALHLLLSTFKELNLLQSCRRDVA